MLNWQEFSGSYVYISLVVFSVNNKEEKFSLIGSLQQCSLKVFFQFIGVIMGDCVCLCMCMSFIDYFLL